MSCDIQSIKKRADFVNLSKKGISSPKIKSNPRITKIFDTDRLDIYYNDWFVYICFII